MGRRNKVFSCLFCEEKHFPYFDGVKFSGLYTLVQRKDMSKGALEGVKLYYAQAVSTRRVEFDDLCDEIADTCTLTSADIKAVLDRVIWGMVTHLKNSEIVQFGDLSNFRIAVGSAGSATPEEFTATMLRKP